MSYVQTSLFDFASCSNDDHIYLQLQRLKENDVLDLYELQVKRTDKFYEVEKTDEFHEGFKALMDCYQFINSKL